MKSRVRFFAAAPLFVALAVAACSDSTGPDDHADEVDTIRVTVGTQTVNITQGGAQGALTIQAGPNNLSATFLADDGDVITLPSSEFEIRIESQNTSLVTYASTGAFTGTLTGVAAGSAVVVVRLWHLEENHEDFGPHNLTVNVQ